MLDESSFASYTGFDDKEGVTAHVITKFCNKAFSENKVNLDVITSEMIEIKIQADIKEDFEA